MGIFTLHYLFHHHQEQLARSQQVLDHLSPLSSLQNTLHQISSLALAGASATKPHSLEPTANQLLARFSALGSIPTPSPLLTQAHQSLQQHIHSLQSLAREHQQALNANQFPEAQALSKTLAGQSMAALHQLQPFFAQLNTLPLVNPHEPLNHPLLEHLAFGFALLALTGLMWLGYSYHQKYQRSRQHTQNPLHQLQASEDALSTVIHRSLDAIIVLNNQYQLLNANPAAQALFGLPLPLTHKPALHSLFALHTPLSSSEEASENLLKQALNQLIEINALNPNQQAIPTELTFVALPGLEGLQYIGFIRDISARKQHEQELLQQANMLAFLDHSQKNFIRDLPTKNRQGLFDELLKGILSLTQSEYGFIGEVIYKPCGTPYLKTYAISNIAWDDTTRDFYYQYDAQGMEFTNLNTLFGAAMKTGRVVIANNAPQDPRRGGIPHGHPPLNAFLGVPLGPQEKLIGLIGLANRPNGFSQTWVNQFQALWSSTENMIRAYRVQDIRKKTERQILEREAKISAIVNTAVNGIILINSKGMIEMFNKAAEKMFGYSAQEIIHQNISQLMPQPHGSQHNHYLQQYLKTGQKHIIGTGREVTALRKDGTPIAVELSVSEWEKDGEPMFVGILHDITERRELEAQRLQIAEEKTRFSAIVSHELRTPMASLRGGLDLLKSSQTGPLNPMQAEIVDIICRNIDRLNRLVNDFLDFQKLEARATELNLSQQDINPLNQQVCQLMAPEAHLHHITLTLQLAPQLPPLQLDEDKITQVLTNLIGNALKFSPAHHKVTLQSQQLSAEWIKESVIDQGEGISPADPKKLFKPFEQITNVKKGKPTGSGMGLAISKRLIERHAGHIGIESQPGQGCTFYFTLPIKKH